MKSAKHRFAVLDAWRGVAACLVALLHFTSWHGFNTHFDDIALVQNSWMMVDFFFVLSGFVISHAAFGKISNAGPAMEFMIRRFGRLWPLDVIILAVFVGISFARSAVLHGSVPPLGPGVPLSAFFYNLLMIQGLDARAYRIWNSPSWSIGLEFYTYFIFVGVCLFAAHRRISTIGLSIVLILLSLEVLVPGGTMQSVNICRCIYGFFAGHLTYLLWCRQKNHVPAMEWVAIALTVVFISFARIEPLQFLAPFVFAFVVWIFTAEAGLPSRLGKLSAMQHLGAWSYSIYMTHMLGIHVFVGILAWMNAQFGSHDVARYWVGDVAALLFLAAVILFSGATYRYIETPARNYFNRLAGRSAVRVSKSSSVV